MKNKDMISFLTAWIFLFTQTVFGANFTDDTLQLGKPGSSADKSVVFGASNKKKLTHKPGTLTLDYEGNNLSVGDGANTSDKTFKLNKGGSSPTFRHNFTSGDLEIENAPVLNQKGNTLSIGDAANTNKVLKFNKGASSPEIRYNSSTSKLEFSNDATLYKAIGSGTGGGGDGGINLLPNPSFEDGATVGWSNTGGTYTQETYTNATDSDSKFVRFVASGAGQYFETPLITVPDNLGFGCMADLKFNQTGASFKMSALDSSGNVLASQDLVTVTSWTKASTIAWQCPAPGATMRLRIESLAAGTADFDTVHFGSNKGLTSNSLVKLAAKVRWTGASNVYNHDQDNKLTFTGASWSTPSGDLTWNSGSQRLIANRAGTYPITFAYRPNMGIDASVQRSHMAKIYVNGSLADRSGFTHGLATNNVNSGGTGGSSTPDPQVTSVLTLAQNDYVEFYGYGSNGAGTNYTISDARVDVLKLADAADAGVTNEQSQWQIEAEIGGASNPNLGTGAYSSFQEVADGGLDLVPAPYSAPVGIACASGGTSTVGTLTCSGNETLGITFRPPYAGYFDVCGTATMYATGTSQVLGVWRMDQVPNSGATSTLSAGFSRVVTGGSAGSQDWGGSSKVCSTIYFGDTAQKTMKMMLVKSSSASASLIYADRAGGSGGARAVYFSVRPALRNHARPVLTGDQVTTPGVSKPLLFGFNYGTTTAATPCSGTPCFLEKTGDVISSVTRSSTGQYVANFDGIYSRVRCTGNASGSGMEAFFFGFPVLTCANCSTLTMNTSRRDTGSFIDTVGTLNCMAIK